jgi:hypothetical protein
MVMQQQAGWLVELTVTVLDEVQPKESTLRLPVGHKQLISRKRRSGIVDDY